MPELNNTRREAFAREGARGRGHRAAHARAAYRPSAGGPNRVRLRPAVRARTAELRDRQEALGKATLEETVLALLDLATGGEQTSAAARREARAARLEAHRLNEQLEQQRCHARRTPHRVLSNGEWLAKYAPKPTA